MPLFHCIPPSLFRYVSFLTSYPYFTVLFIHQPPNYTLISIPYFSTFTSRIDAFIFIIFFVLYFFYMYFYYSYKFSSEFYFTHQF